MLDAHVAKLVDVWGRHRPLRLLHRLPHSVLMPFVCHAGRWRSIRRAGHAVADGSAKGNRQVAVIAAPLTTEVRAAVQSCAFQIVKV